jgi:hypothetical protein
LVRPSAKIDGSKTGAFFLLKANRMRIRLCFTPANRVNIG